MDCRKCEIYKETNGIGKLECKKCPKYKRFQITNTQRPKLIFEELSELIKESCMCEEKDISIIDCLRKLPPQSSVPLMMSICLDMSIREIAKYHDCSKTKMDTVIKKSVIMLKACIAIS